MFHDKLEKKTIALIIMIFILAIPASGYFYLSYFESRNVIGIIDVSGAILTSQDADRYTEMIKQAIHNDSIKAVVLRIDCPGGDAEQIEGIYLDLLELKATKPVIASVVFAASGGYYISVAADYIYAEPTSFLGNVGVIGTAPPVLIPSEVVLETGPYKATGFSELLFPFNLSTALDNFASAVEKGRGDRLKLTFSQLRSGLLYIGSDAVKLGLADEIGSLQKAIKNAAGRAGVREYDVADMDRALGDPYTIGASASNQTSSSVEWQSLTLADLNRIHSPPAIWYLYLSPEFYAQIQSSDEGMRINPSASVFGGGGGGKVLVDESHGNAISAWELDVLIAELAVRNITVKFITNSGELGSELDSATGLIVASPTIPYSDYECEDIERFVSQGGTLLLFYDPALEYVDISSLFGPMDSLSTRFGLSFAKGYLYNELENYGFYRNVLARTFADSPITNNLTGIVFFTATHIYSANKGVAWAIDNTYSSASERADNYTVIAWVTRGAGTIIAFGDQTFLREPYCYVEDNYKLIQNLISVITAAASRG